MPPTPEQLQSEGLLRTVSKGLLEDGRPSPRVFEPTAVDEGKLSVDRQTLTTPEDCFNRRKAVRKNTVGVMGVTTDEVDELGLAAFADPVEEDDDDAVQNPSHAYIDFGEDRTTDKAHSELLLIRAEQRGWLFGGA